MAMGKLFPFRIPTQAKERYDSYIALGYLDSKVMPERLRDTFFSILQEVESKVKKPYNRTMERKPSLAEAPALPINNLSNKNEVETHETAPLKGHSILINSDIDG